MTRSAPVASDFKLNVTALLVIGSIRLLNEAASAAEKGRSRPEDVAWGFIESSLSRFGLELLAWALVGGPGK